MVTVKQAEQGVLKAERELARIEVEMVSSESIAWRDWAEGQVKEFIRTQPDVWSALSTESRKALKEQLSALVEQQAEAIAERLSGFPALTFDEIVEFRHERAWEEIHRVPMEGLKELLVNHGFGTAGSYVGWDWQGRWGSGSGDLALSPQNPADRAEFFQALRDLTEARRVLREAQQREAGEAALDEWGSL